MIQVPPVKSQRQSIRYSESEENDMIEDDSRNINQLRLSPSKRKQPAMISINRMMQKNEG
jgi:hypothetical protein